MYCPTGSRPVPIIAKPYYLDKWQTFYLDHHIISNIVTYTDLHIFWTAVDKLLI